MLRIPRHLAIVLALLMVGTALNWRVGRFPFINLDDPLYVTGNPVVRDGLAPGGIA